ncbi:MAG TPA: trypsin-like serine protease [Kofleriaceae bacterium]|nr:trypsin-like serine protease [Kofleriaceae bacterium]
MSRTPGLLAALCPAALLVACGPSVGPGGDASEIVGGFPIGIEEAPWQISLQDPDFGHFCGGSIMSSEFVLTAQHCTEGSGEMIVVAGIDRLSDTPNGQAAEVDKVIPFPGFTDPTAGKDVSLLHLAQPLELDGVRTAPIAIADAEAVALGLTDPDVVSTVSGWGTLTEGGGQLPDELQAVEVPIVSTEEAQAAYPDVIITADQIGAGIIDDGGKDSCQGDSGGPLIVPDAEGSGFLLAGVVSWGEGCAEPNAPGMYARVSSFADFINDNLSRGGGTEPPPDDPPPDDPPPPRGGQLLINEVLADPGTGDFNGDGVASTTEDEFIELVNVGDDVLDLSEATIADGFGVRGTLPVGTELEAGQVALVFGGGAPTGFDGPTFTFTLGLNNDGDSVTVAAADGTVLDQMTYGAEGGQDQSLVRSVEGEQSDFVLHTEVSSQPASPGTRADGTAF